MNNNVLPVGRQKQMTWGYKACPRVEDAAYILSYTRTTNKIDTLIPVCLFDGTTYYVTSKKNTT
jgi:hypothetical protein